MSGQVEDSAECPNCGAKVEPEQDDDLVYYPCGCGYEFGYQRVQQEDSCAAGIPLGHLATLQGSNVSPGQLGAGPSESAVFLGNVIPVRPGDN